MYRSLLLSTCIYPEENRSETLCRTIIDTVKEKALLLEKYKKFHEDQFGPETHKIPNSFELCLSKMSHGGSISTNTCNYSRKLPSLLVEEVTKICEEKYLEKGEDSANVLIMKTYYHNHLQMYGLVLLPSVYQSIWMRL